MSKKGGIAAAVAGIADKVENNAPCQYETLRRLLLARVLAQDAPLLLVDEPGRRP